MTNITIPNNVGRIGTNAFLYCTSLNGVTIGSGITNIADSAFFYCTNLTGVCFQGNAPVPTNDLSVFSSDANAIVYYLPGTTGWGPAFDGLPTMLWNPQAQTSDGFFGVQNNHFGFTIAGTSNLVIVVEACTNLSNPAWQPVQTNTLTGGSSFFSDPQWRNFPSRFYRIHPP